MNAQFSMGADLLLYRFAARSSFNAFNGSTSETVDCPLADIDDCLSIETVNCLSIETVDCPSLETVDYFNGRQ